MAELALRGALFIPVEVLEDGGVDRVEDRVVEELLGRCALEMPDDFEASFVFLREPVKGVRVVVVRFVAGDFKLETLALTGRVLLFLIKVVVVGEDVEAGFNSFASATTSFSFGVLTASVGN